MKYYSLLRRFACPPWAMVSTIWGKVRHPPDAKASSPLKRGFLGPSRKAGWLVFPLSGGNFPKGWLHQRGGFLLS